MHHELGDIDPQLRRTAIMAKILFRPALWHFRLMHWLMSRLEGKVSAGLSLEQRWIDRSDGRGRIRLCVYRPDTAASQSELPVILYLHGGGFAMGNPEATGSVIARMIETRPCIVVAPDYRKSIVAPYPAAIDDCFDALLWIDSHRKQLRAADNRIAVVGHSAGGGLTAAVTLRARDRKTVDIAFQMPIYPMIDDRMNNPSVVDNNAPAWNEKSNRLAWDIYLRDLHDRRCAIPYDAAPARATDFSGLPPTVTYVSELDPFKDETFAYVDRLRAAGVPVKFQYYPGAFHGSEVLAPKASVSKAMVAFFLTAFAEAMDGRFETWATE
ncbi:alpha/beta hydrolase [uncultured Parasphingorhabdus sp.]|uniref:alpha/beta hydrolase n=1 Tax=uncultured Parasphingorhabdus sp. TaxID=2709694 RepID=UPI002AA88C4A|nr:alpha/beta hydrolase [uncultured Parasphingorhabdus sp.]